MTEAMHTEWQRQLTQRQDGGLWLLSSIVNQQHTSSQWDLIASGRPPNTRHLGIIVRESHITVIVPFLVTVMEYLSGEVQFGLGGYSPSF